MPDLLRAGLRDVPAVRWIGARMSDDDGERGEMLVILSGMIALVTVSLLYLIV